MSDLEPTLWNNSGEVIGYRLGTSLVPATVSLTLSPERQRELDTQIDEHERLRAEAEQTGEQVIIL